MKNIKQIFALLLAVAMCFSFTACKKSSDGTESGSGLSYGVSEDTNAGDGTGSGGDTANNNESAANGGGASGNTSAATQGGSSNNKNKDFGGKTVTIIYEYQPSDKKGIDPSRDRELDRIAEIQKKYNVKIVQKKGASNYHESNVASITAGKPVGDIIKLNGNKNYDYIKAGLCADFNSAIKETGININASHYLPLNQQYYNVNGKQYGISLLLPQESDANALWFYNKDILSEVGYSANYINDLYKSGNWTWAEATKLFAAVQKKNANGTVERYALGCAYAYNTVISLALNNNTKIGSVDKAGNPIVNLNTPAVREVLQQFYDWGAVNKYIAPSESDAVSSMFKKGEVFIYTTNSGGAKNAYNSGINFGVVLPPKGPRASKNVSMVRTGNTYIVPVTYQANTSMYLTILDALYAPYSDASAEDILKADNIQYFSDVDSWNIFKAAAYDSSIRVADDFYAFNLEWANPAFGTVCLNLMKGTLTPATMVEKYNDQYQALLDDKFNGFKLTGVK